VPSWSRVQAARVYSPRSTDSMPRSSPCAVVRSLVPRFSSLQQFKYRIRHSLVKSSLVSCPLPRLPASPSSARSPSFVPHVGGNRFPIYTHTLALPLPPSPPRFVHRLPSTGLHCGPGSPVMRPHSRTRSQVQSGSRVNPTKYVFIIVVCISVTHSPCFARSSCI